MAKPLEIHVISNTHWDREWLFNFQETRMLLVEFFDRLIGILDKHEDYKAFLLDAQTVPLEDYLEVRPEKRGKLEEFVKAGRLHVGPWYTDPECFCVGGESLVRNMTYGHKVAREFGNVMKVGYTPFSYGQNSQMPQIYAGFGIDAMLFYHGVSHEEVPNEYWFEGADGTRILASQLSSMARYNYYYHVYRPAKYGTAIGDRMYQWPQGGSPFHLCSESHAPEHHILLDPKWEYNKERLLEGVKKLRHMEEACGTTRVAAFMMGHDSSMADELELLALEDAQEVAGKDKIIHSTLPDYIERVKKQVKDLRVLKGERRTPKPMPVTYHLYSDVLSSRTRMKRLNTHAEHALQRWAEPFAALAWQLGAEYPQSLLDMAWKTLLKCHAHDSIAGSGIDEIEKDMWYRLRQVVNISDGLKLRALQHMQARIDNSDLAPDDMVLTVFNPSAQPRTEVVTAVVDLPRTSGIKEFQLEQDGVKKPLDVQAHSRKPHHAIVNHTGDAPAMMACERVTVHFEAREVPALGYTTFRVDRTGTFRRGSMVTGTNSMENEHLRVAIDDDGTFTVTHKATGTEFDDLHSFEDCGEGGMAWMHIRLANDEVVSSVGCPVTVSLVEDGPFLTAFRIDYRMMIPAGLDDNGSDPWQRLDGIGNNAKRTAKKVELLVSSTLTLRKDAKALEVTTRFDNVADNHRLRIMFPTNRKGDTCHVETAFDVVERETAFGKDSPWEGSVGVTFPMQRFVDVSDGKVGLAIINDGLREYEVTQTPERAIAMTLMRAYEVNLTTVSHRWDPHPEMRLSQAQGEHEFRYLVYPHAGTWEKADLYSQVEQVVAPLEPAQAGPHKGDLPKSNSFLRVEGTNIVLSALKRAEDGQGIVVRLFNPSTRKQTAKITCAQKIASVEEITLEEVRKGALTPSGKSVSVEVGKKKIVTVRLVLK
jgi:alpha-mannosidase